jgi:putative hydrolase of the HAD superfamily
VALGKIQITKHPVITAILFDFGGVLAEEGFRNGLVALASEQALDVNDFPRQGMRAVYDSRFVLGQGTEADFWDLLRQRSGLVGADEELKARIMSGFVVRQSMIELVQQLREQGYVTGILSDQTHWLDELDARYHFSHVFDRVYNSYYLGKGKRDNSLFSDIAADLKLDPAAILFVDDDEGNVARAEEMGFRVIHFVSQEGFELTLERMLSENA